MIGAEEILAGVQLADRNDYILRNASVNERLGFLTMQSPLISEGYEVLLGFSVPGHQVGAAELPATTQSITEFDYIPESQRTLADLHMGIGIRLYNTWQAATVLPENFQHIGAYIMIADIDGIGNLLGRPSKIGQRIDRILQLGMAYTLGLEKAVRTIDSFQEGDVTLHAQEMPVSEAQERHRQPPLEGISERIAIVRNPNAVLTKVGEVSLEQVTSTD